MEQYQIRSDLYDFNVDHTFWPSWDETHGAHSFIRNVNIRMNGMPYWQTYHNQQMQQYQIRPDLNSCNVYNTLRPSWDELHGAPPFSNMNTRMYRMSYSGPYHDRQMKQYQTPPSLIIFDLDKTLWPFWVGSLAEPFGTNMHGQIVDQKGTVIQCYPEVPAVLHYLYDQEVWMGVASRTGAVGKAEHLLQMFGWQQYFCVQEIYQCDKTAHFRSFSEKTGVPFSHMLFFDDEERNVSSVSGLGVTCVHVPDGMSMSKLQEGLDIFSERMQSYGWF